MDGNGDFFAAKLSQEGASTGVQEARVHHTNIEQLL